MKYKIYLDGGHSTLQTPGKETPFIKSLGRKIKEAEFNHAVVKKLIALCKKYGIGFFEVSPDIKVDIPLGTRVNRVNSDYRQFMAQDKTNKAVVVSVHCNAHLTTFEGSDAQGVETYHNLGSVEGKKLADSVHKELIKGTKQTNRGVKSSDFTIIAKTTPTAILVETLFMDDEKESLLMLSDSFQSEVANEIFQGVLNYWGIKVSDLNPTPTEQPKPTQPTQPTQPKPCEDCAKVKSENTQLKARITQLENQIQVLQKSNEQMKVQLDVANSKINKAILELTR